jgi:hypothetical protein
MEWDENCLAPHKNVRAVKTASSWQVRQPVYRTSLARWKRYRKFIPELLDELGYSPEQGTR